MNKSASDARQIAALPIRWDQTGKLRVLMVTSRDTRRWVMPKGWLMDGKKPWHAAEIEALEEAGAVGVISHRPIGADRYKKRMSAGRSIICRVTVYPMIVDKLKKRWKERAERKRHWFSLRKAATLVEEEELSEILKELARQPDQMEILQELREAS